MIDTFRKIAVLVRPLRHVAVILGVVCLAAALAIVLVAPASGEQNRYLVPAMVGFVWCLSAWGFIDTFQSVPERKGPGDGFFTGLKRGLYRGWFWLLAVAFTASTLAVVFLTYRLGSFWLGKYFG